MTRFVLWAMAVLSGCSATQHGDHAAARYDFTGNTAFPFTTHAMSGLGHIVDEYTAAGRGAALGEALAIQVSRPL